MATSVLIVHTNPLEGREDEYNEWYNNTHLKDVTAVPGFVRARRFKLSDSQMRPFGQFDYVAIYEIDGDPAPAIAALKEATAAGMYISEAMSQELHATVYESVTDWVSAN